MIHIYSRHCAHSNISAHKERPAWFSRKACFRNLLRTSELNNKDIQMHVVFDGTEEELEKSYVRELWNGDVIRYEYRSEARGFCRLVNDIIHEHDDNDIIYFVEDDYLHRMNWPTILREGFDIPRYEDVKYRVVTLYDHADKYNRSMYPCIRSYIYITDSCHWRSTPSTCHTFATTVKCLRDLMSIWIKYSTGVMVTMDHEKFIELGKYGTEIISCIPGYSTHVQPPWLSPVPNLCISWKFISQVDSRK